MREAQEAYQEGAASHISDFDTLTDIDEVQMSFEAAVQDFDVGHTNSLSLGSGTEANVTIARAGQGTLLCASPFSYDHRLNTQSDSPAGGDELARRRRDRKRRPRRKKVLEREQSRKLMKQQNKSRLQILLPPVAQSELPWQKRRLQWLLKSAASVLARSTTEFKW